MTEIVYLVQSRKTWKNMQVFIIFFKDLLRPLKKKELSVVID